MDANCEKCDSEISTEASKCPYCGYEPSSEGELVRRLTLASGFILTGTIVGAIVGIPLIIVGLRAQKQAKELTPATTTH